MTPHSSTLAWKIPWTEEPARLQSMGSLKSDTTEQLHFHFSLSCIGEGNGNPLQCSCLENPRDGGAWWAAVSGVAQSRTRLNRQQQQQQTIAFQAPLPMEFSRQKYQSGLPFPTPRDLPDPGIEPMPPALVDGFFTTVPPGKIS